jgi:hypothetical protein
LSGAFRFDGALPNPTLIVDVLSPSTEGYDRGAKLAHYRRVESLREVLLVSQGERVVEHYARAPDGSWRLRDFYPSNMAGVSIESTEPIAQVDRCADAISRICRVYGLCSLPVPPQPNHSAAKGDHHGYD